MSFASRMAITMILLASGCDRTTVLDARPDRSSCETCHRSIGADGHESGIETAHTALALSCDDCHGGDPGAFSRAAAHTSGTSTKLRGASTIGLTQLPASQVRFSNPADLRIAQVSCGIAQGQACHDTIVSAVQRSLMATFAGGLTLPRRLVGIGGEPVGVVDAIDGAELLEEGAVPRVVFFAHPRAIEASDADLLDLYLRKACARCHAYDFGVGQQPGDFRGDGCGVCHVPYTNDGTSSTEDAVGVPDPPAPALHRLERTPGEQSCARCHVGGARIALSFHGLVPTEALGYLETTALQDALAEHEPDIHAQAGMTCTDCHAGGELHGGQSLHATRYTSPTVRCSDCHGELARRVTPGPDGRFRAEGGWTISTLELDATGNPVLRAGAGAALAVPQLADVDRTGRESHGREHVRLACASCHSTFTIQCVGCHVTVDESEPSSASLIDGSWSLGGTIEEEGFAIDTSMLLLGEAPDGTVYPVVPAQAVLVTHIDPDGTVLRDREILRRDGEPAFGLAAVDPHTVGKGRACDACHIATDGANEQAVRRLIGASPSAAVIEDGAGTRWDIGHLLDDELSPRIQTPRGRARPLGTERARMLLEEPLR